MKCLLTTLLTIAALSAPLATHADDFDRWIPIRLQSGETVWIYLYQRAPGGAWVYVPTESMEFPVTFHAVRDADGNLIEIGQVSDPNAVESNREVHTAGDAN